MNRNVLIAFLVCLVLGTIVVVALRPNDTAESNRSFQDLARQQAKSDTLEAGRDIQAASDLDQLAEAGRGQSLPPYLVSNLDGSGDYWFVGKPGVNAGVEIPFEPGKLPTPIPDRSSPERVATANPGYLGAEACRGCHAKQFDTYVQTAHYQTCRIATPDQITGSLQPGDNTLTTQNPEVQFEMIQSGSVAYQQVSFFGWQFRVPFHLIFGSSKMAETYLYWHGDRLYQHNATYLTEPDKWINSPGYIDGDAAYARPIPLGCVECHATYIDYLGEPNRYDPHSLILGVSCERCHGPGKQHAEYHDAHPDDKVAKHVSVPTDFSREREMDICAQCHTSNKVATNPDPFSFRPGDRLEDHFRPDPESVDSNRNTVHASNQVNRLSASVCFQQSDMGCVDCHNPHRNERGQTALFSKRCLTCHETQQCGAVQEHGDHLASNCIDCHMPNVETENLRIEDATGEIFPPLRDHLIRIDTEAAQRYLAQLKSQ